jgi:hypothetical protein
MQLRIIRVRLDPGPVFTHRPFLLGDALDRARLLDVEIVTCGEEMLDDRFEERAIHSRSAGQQPQLTVTAGMAAPALEEQLEGVTGGIVPGNRHTHARAVSAAVIAIGHEGAAGEVRRKSKQLVLVTAGNERDQGSQQRATNHGWQDTRLSRSPHGWPCNSDAQNDQPAPMSS